MCFGVFDLFDMFSLGRVVLYTVFMVLPLPTTLVRTLAKNLIKNLAYGHLELVVAFLVVIFFGCLVITLHHEVGSGRK